MSKLKAMLVFFVMFSIKFNSNSKVWAIITQNPLNDNMLDNFCALQLLPVWLGGEPGVGQFDSDDRVAATVPTGGELYN